MAPRNDWTTAEDEVLRRMRSEGTGYREISVALGRTASACCTRATTIGAGAALNSWTPDEEERLAAMMRDRLSYEAAARVLGRTVSAIKARAWVISSNPFPRRDRRPTEATKERKCIRCTIRMRSPHAGVRMCDTCRTTHSVNCWGV